MADIGAKCRLTLLPIWNPVPEVAEMLGNTVAKLRHVDIACFEYDGGIAVLDQRLQEMFEGDAGVALAEGRCNGALQRAAQIMRHLDALERTALLGLGHFVNRHPRAGSAVGLCIMIWCSIAQFAAVPNGDPKRSTVWPDLSTIT